MRSICVFFLAGSDESGGNKSNNASVESQEKSASTGSNDGQSQLDSGYGGSLSHENQGMCGSGADTAEISAENSGRSANRCFHSSSLMFYDRNTLNSCDL